MKKNYFSHGDWLVRVLDEKEFEDYQDRGYRTAMLGSREIVVVNFHDGPHQEETIYLDEFRTRGQLRSFLRMIRDPSLRGKIL